MSVKEVFSPAVPMAFTHIWTVFAGGASLTGGYYRVNAGGVIQRNFDTTYSSVFVALTAKIADITTGIQRIVLYASGSPNSPQITVAPQTNGDLRVYSGGTTETLLTTYAAGIQSATEVNIEIAATIHASTGTVTVRVNGVEVIALTGVNTDPRSTGSVNGFCVSAFSGSIFDFKNYAWGVGETLFNPLGGGLYVLTLTADGSVTQWTPDTGSVHYSRINAEGTVGPGYVTAGSGGNVDVFPAGAFPAGGWRVRAVSGFYYLQPGTAIATTSFRPLVRRGGVNTNWGVAQSHPNPIFPAYRVTAGVDLALDPTTAAAWVDTDLSAGTVEFGMTDTASANARVGQLSVVVWLTPVYQGAVQLTATGTLTGTATIVISGAATFTATGTLTGTGSVVARVGALALSVMLTATARVWGVLMQTATLYLQARATATLRREPRGEGQMADQYAVGNLVRVYVHFRDSDGTLTDPSTVVAKYQNPAASETTKTYGVDAEVVKVATGIYYIEISLSSAGTWYYRFNGTGGVTAADEKYLIALATEF